MTRPALRCLATGIGSLVGSLILAVWAPGEPEPITIRYCWDATECASPTQETKP